VGQSPWKVALLKADYLRAKGQTAQTPAQETPTRFRRCVTGDLWDRRGILGDLVPYYEQIEARADADRAAHCTLPSAGMLPIPPLAFESPPAQAQALEQAANRSVFGSKQAPR
jgi:hypothetical protein